MSFKITASASEIDPKLNQVSDNEFILEINSGDTQFSLQLNKLQVQTLGLKCVQFVPDPDSNSRFNNISNEDSYRIPLNQLVILDDREIQTILTQGQSKDLKLFLWYMQDSTELVDKIFNNMSRRAADMMRDDLKIFPDPHPDKAPERRLEQAREASQNIMKLVTKLQACGEIAPF